MEIEQDTIKKKENKNRGMKMEKVYRQNKNLRNMPQKKFATLQNMETRWEEGKDIQLIKEILTEQTQQEQLWKRTNTKMTKL